MNEAHLERQRAAREAKAQRRTAHQAQSRAHTRVDRQIEVDKEHLLKMLKAESLIPEDAARIIGTGHRPDVLTVVYTLEPA